MTYRPDIDALRGIAVILVIIFHAFPNILPGGYIGVDIFFVISGFLITLIIKEQYNKGEFSIIDFYKRRIKRIFPSLLTIVIFSLIIGWYILYPSEYFQLTKHSISSLLFYQNFNLEAESGYFNISSTLKPFLHLWSLSIEEQFYLIWPIVLILALKVDIRPIYLISIGVIISFSANIYFVNPYENAVFYLSFTRFWEIGVGAILALKRSKNHTTDFSCPKYSKFLFVIGLGMIFLASLSGKQIKYIPYFIQILLPICGASLVIFSKLKLKRWYGLVFIGLISYPLYLWHWVLISISRIYIGGELEAILLMGLICISILFAYLNYKYIEKVRYSTSRLVIPLLLGIAFILVSWSKHVVNNKGFLKRNYYSHLHEFQNERVKSIREGTISCNKKQLNTNEIMGFNCLTNSSYNEKNSIIAVIGDSHASSIFSGIKLIAENNNYNALLLSKAGCLPFYDDEGIPFCNKAEEFLKIIRSNTNIKKVILVTRGPAYIHGEMKGEYTEKAILENSKNIKRTYSSFFGGFKNMLEKLDEINHVEHLYYYLENPELDFDPRIGVSRPFDFWNISKQKNTVTKKLFRLRMKEYRKLSLKLGYKFDKLTIIESEPYFCEEEKCFSTKNGKSLYFNDDHLSVYGAQYLASMTENILF